MSYALEIKFREQLAKAFLALRQSGIYAEQNWTCCQSCGFAEMETEKGAKANSKVLFYHGQDEEKLSQGSIYLAHRNIKDTDLQALRDAGLVVEWNGNIGVRIRVSAV